MAEMVYHFTDTARLPWILRSGELRPGSNKIGGLPDPDFLWATTNSQGDRTASSSLQSELYRGGRARMVRFTLRADDFEPWREVVSRFPAWKTAHVEMLERVAKSSPVTWCCRTEPLPRSRWVAIDTRSYVDKTWRLFDGSVMDGDDGTLGVEIAGKQFFSLQKLNPGAATGYSVIVRAR
jgi:hypothetical protein